MACRHGHPDPNFGCDLCFPDDDGPVFNRALLEKIKTAEKDRYDMTREKSKARTAGARPISPKDVAKKAVELIPDEIIESANELIVENWTGHQAVVTLADIASRARAKMGKTAAHEFRSTDFDIEPIFRKAGWGVEFYKPCYYGGDTGEQQFTFTRRRTRG